MTSVQGWTDSFWAGVLVSRLRLWWPLCKPVALAFCCDSYEQAIICKNPSFTTSWTYPSCGFFFFFWVKVDINESIILLTTCPFLTQLEKSQMIVQFWECLVQADVSASAKGMGLHSTLPCSVTAQYSPREAWHGYCTDTVMDLGGGWGRSRSELGEQGVG